jgi:hypothetical protein
MASKGQWSIFDTNLDNWKNVNGVFRFNSDNVNDHSGRTTRDNGGNGVGGVLRSSAFTISTNKYIRFD